MNRDKEINLQMHTRTHAHERTRCAVNPDLKSLPSNSAAPSPCMSTPVRQGASRGLGSSVFDLIILRSH